MSAAARTTDKSADPMIVACRSPRKTPRKDTVLLRGLGIRHAGPPKLRYPPSPTRAAAAHSCRRSDRMKTKLMGGNQQATTGSVMIALSTSNSCILLSLAITLHWHTPAPVGVKRRLQSESDPDYKNMQHILIPPPLALQSTI